MPGSNGIDSLQRVKTLKALWDATNTGFGSRHKHDERYYRGSYGGVRRPVHGRVRRGLLDRPGPGRNKDVNMIGRFNL
ncbi:4-hydroxyphenylacetate 3-hydroxylase C-terminal domain-containing protein [Arthrobacter ginkgonis]|uniref:4-hydroxyphenylacetate 3-hydroxylase C-terminal domain-containing protein n=1 Tax=Arthrobacter ginkgonis TaxID=1630594 RepID=UPI0031EA128F